MRYQPSFRGGGCLRGYVCVCEVWMVLCVWTWIRDGRHTEERKAPCWHDPGNRVTSFFLSFVLSCSLSFSLSLFLSSWLSLSLLQPSPRPVPRRPCVCPSGSPELGCGVPGGGGAGGLLVPAGGGLEEDSVRLESRSHYTRSCSPLRERRARREERKGKEPTSSCSVPRCPYL